MARSAGLRNCSNKSKPLKVSAHHFSAQAREKIVAAGGTVTEIPGPAPVVRNPSVRAKAGRQGKAASRKKPVSG